MNTEQKTTSYPMDTAGFTIFRSRDNFDTFILFFWKEDIPLCVMKYILYLVPSIHNTYKDKMLY